MATAKVKIDTEHEEQQVKKTCEYKGVTYFVLTDMEGKSFIEVDGERRYLDKNGKVANKKKGTRSCKTSLESFEDAKKVQDYFIENSMWNHYMMFTLNFNTGRRIEDIRLAMWKDFFDESGKIRKYWLLEEKKTKKNADVYINDAVKEAFETYIKEEKIDINLEYQEPIFKNRRGAHKGKIMSQEGYRKALIKASEVIGYEIRSHSMRRGMGSMMMELHPNDPKAKSILMSIYNHSSEKMTNKYIGETAKMEEEYFKDLGKRYNSYVQHGEEIPFAEKKPVSVYDNKELRNYMLCAFGKILDNANETDTMKLLELYNSLLDGLENIAR